MTKSETASDSAVKGGPSPGLNGASGDGSGGSGLTRVTVNLSRQAVQALEQVSAATNYTKTDTINRALQIYAIVQKILERDDGVLQVKHKDGELVQIHIL